MDETAWAVLAANEILKNHGTAGAVDTANYMECSFIIAAAIVCQENPAFAQLVGELMEPPRVLPNQPQPLESPDASEKDGKGS